MIVTNFLKNAIHLFLDMFFVSELVPDSRKISHMKY